MTDWWDFVDRYLVLRKINGSKLAEAAGFDKSQVSSWRNEGALPKVHTARSVAKALNAPVLDAFVAAGFLDPSDTTAEVIERPVSQLGDEELLAEVGRRMRGERNAVHQTPPPGTSSEGDKAQEDVFGVPLEKSELDPSPEVGDRGGDERPAAGDPL